MSDPGWYQDPSDARFVRFYNGSQWTEHIKPAPNAPRSADPGLAFIIPVNQSGLALAAGYLGLFSFILWPLGPFAIYAGIKARSAERVGPAGLRIATGFIGGVFGTVLTAIALVMVVSG